MSQSPSLQLPSPPSAEASGSERATERGPPGGERKWGADSSPGVDYRGNGGDQQLKLAVLERQAVHMLALEVCMDRRVRLGTPLGTTYKVANKEKLLPRKEQFAAFRLGITNKLDLVQRYDVARKTCDCPDGPRVHAAAECYRGKYVSNADAMALGNERISLTPMGAEGESVDWWLKTCPSGLGFPLEEHAYGKPLWAIKAWDACETFHARVRLVTDDLIDRLLRSQIFGSAPELVDALVIYNIASYDLCHARLMQALNDFTAPGAKFFRSKLIDRTLGVAKGRGQIDSVKRLVQGAMVRRKTEAPEGESLIFNLLTSVDHWQESFEDFSAADAANFLQVYLGQCPRGADGKRVVDETMVKALRQRFPRLQIFTVTNPKYKSQQFPHHTGANGAGAMYKDQLLHIPIGMVTSRLRTRVRAEGRARKVRAERVLDALYEIPPLQPEEEGNHEKDHGYREHEHCLYAMVGDMTDPVTPIRRVKNNGWSEVEYALDPDHQLNACDPMKYFEAPPVVGVVLVHATTRAPVVPGHPHGGMTPQADLVSAAHYGAKLLLCPKLVHPPGYGHPWLSPTKTWQMPYQAGGFTKDQPMYGVVAKFWPTCLTNEHNGAQFRIVVTCTGTNRRRPQESLVISTETEPFVFYANSRVGKRPAGALVGRANRAKV